MTEKYNIGVYEKDKKTLIFIDQKPFMSGELIKNITSFHFKMEEWLKQKVSQDNSIGRVIELGDVVFLIVRKHFNSKINRENFRKIIFNLPAGQIYKTTKESFVDYAEEIENMIDKLPFTVQFYDVSGFGQGIYKKIENKGE
jgi:hypothetical protein